MKNKVLVELIISVYILLKKMKTTSLPRFTASIIKDIRPIRLLIALAILTILSVLLIPTIRLTYNHYTIEKDISNAWIWLFILILLSFVKKIYNTYILRPLQQEFKIVSTGLIVERLICMMYSIEYDALRDNKASLRELSNHALWGVTWTIELFTSRLFSFLTFFSAIIMLFYEFPFGGSLCVESIIYAYISNYILGSVTDRLKIHNKYGILHKKKRTVENSAYYSIIHGEGDKICRDTVSAMKDMKRLDAEWDKDSRKSTILIEYTTLFVTFLNSYIAYSYYQDVGLLFSVYMYMIQIQSNVTIFIDIYKQYLDSKKEYDKLMLELKKYDAKDDYEHVKEDIKEIHIENLVYVRKDLENCKEFVLNLQDPVTLKHGKYVLLDGESGSGKSTFLDIIAGIIPNKKAEYEIYINNKESKHGFHYVENKRVYIEQSEDVNWRNSIFTIITGLWKDDTNAEDLPIHSGLVEKALEIAECGFVTDMHSVIGLSGGQQCRVLIARSIYNILLKKPSIVIFDEIDKSVSEKLAVKIVNNILSLIKTNDMIGIFVVHLNVVKDLFYTEEDSTVLNFDNGTITVQE